MIRPVSMAFVLCCTTVALCSCESLPQLDSFPKYSWDALTRTWVKVTAGSPSQSSAPAPPPPMQEPPPAAVVPVASHINDEFMMRLDVLDADITKLKRQLAETQKENARLKKELDDAQQDNMLLKDLASKRGR